MTFSPTTQLSRRNAINQILGFRIVDHHDKYLGMPASIGKKTKKEIFAYLQDRVVEDQGLGGETTVQAGKEVLIKAVLQAIPTYVMSCFLLPEELINEIEMAIRRFWWGNGENKGMAWLSWGEMCKAKELGRLGFRDLKAFNIALLYFPHGYLFNADVGSRPSTTWRSIWKVIPFFKMGLRRRIGSDLDTSIWGDPWLRGGGGFKVFTKRPSNLAFPDRVSDLIESNTNSWNMQLINDVFWPVDVERILAIPVGNGGSRATHGHGY
ncbi:PREDICTED: uncharacterized protein LOC105961808 [Erythranthe guttata]|uniref:uncharacterized protein LOC105961808 n=1 Tax=Erythranthe guttata TaxID=4155 RepID=UPI00064DF13F|nr:PREDICTED: uncharacterized protein LOC105961808 [Erythranthe guttata]|eukprot:XP_012841526.1 PREDICTED: uncharacterized protein LOC105961808 [Erythranthe guttata]